MDTNQMKTAKLACSLNSDEALDRMLKALEASPHTGRVRKYNLLSWIILYFEKNCFERCKEQIQKESFDELVYLSSIVKQLRQAKREGLPANVRDLLAPLGLSVKRGASKNDHIQKTSPEEKGLPTM